MKIGKNKKPGSMIFIKTKKDEHPLIMEWINKQNNMTDSLRFLIEQDIKENGIRNLQEYIPSIRSFEENDLNNNSPNKYFYDPKKEVKPKVNNPIKNIPKTKNKNSETIEKKSTKLIDNEFDEDTIGAWS